MNITNGQLAGIIAEILTNPFSGEVASQESFEQFCTEVAHETSGHDGFSYLLRTIIRIIAT